MNEAKAQFEFDLLRVYMGEDYDVNEKIHIHQPTIGEIVKWGENRYFSMIRTLCSIPSDRKSSLYDCGIDWETITDFNYFALIASSLPQKETSIVLGDLDLSSMEVVFDEGINKYVLFDEKKDIKIDMHIYQKMIDYIRLIHNIVPNIEKAANQRTKFALIEYEREQIKKNSLEKNTSILLPLISSMVNSAGFKFNTKELSDITLYQFMDSVQRIQVITSTTALLYGQYTGMVDIKKIDRKEFSWTRELTKDVANGENLRIPANK